MKVEQLQVGWVDLLTVIVLLLGVVIGRKRGLSQELLDTLRWVCIFIVAACFYEPLARFLYFSAFGRKPVVSMLTLYVSSWLTIALLITLVFSMIKSRFGSKLVGSDAFGAGEYYLGMAAGALRFLVIYACFLNLLRAPYVAPDQLRAQIQQQEKDLGATYFPPFGSIQQAFMAKSFTGTRFARYLGPMLIRPTSSSSEALRDENSMARRRERTIDAMMGGK